ncbi:hypothetical protein [Bacteroides acidifaciens]|uniref:hypothetical protein n=1 Tax=Bacteroides acidifaciens TaxID=85831 RepID=UPI00263B6F80|nr:hypothetical protein [Bacteroides acidifaciens]
MPKREKSKSQIAWERKLGEVRHDLNAYRSLCDQKDTQIRELKERISELESKLQEKEDWISRLLEYTEMNPEDMKRKISCEKDAVRLMEGFRWIGEFLNNGRMM